MVFELGELLFLPRTEECGQQLLFEARQPFPLALAPIDKISAGAEKTSLVHLGDAQYLAPCQVDQRSDDILHVGAVVEQEPGQPRGKLVRRFGQIVGDPFDRFVAAEAIPHQIDQHRAAQQQGQPQKPEGHGRHRPPAFLKSLFCLHLGRLRVSRRLPGRRTARNDPRCELHAHLQHLARREAALAFKEGGPVAVQQTGKHLVARLCCAEVGTPLLDRGRAGHHHPHARGSHRELPVGKDRLPPELVAASIVAQAVVHPIAQRVALGLVGLRKIPANRVAAANVVDHKGVGQPATLRLGVAVSSRVDHRPVRKRGQMALGNVAVAEGKGAIQKSDRLVLGYIEGAIQVDLQIDVEPFPDQALLGGAGGQRCCPGQAADQDRRQPQPEPTR